VIDSTNIIQLIGNFGFPMALAIYLLLRFENRLESLKSAIDKLAETMREFPNINKDN